MRHENAVSEVIGAVLLIGVVMLSIAVIGVILLSTPPPDKTPKASLTAYCVRCDIDASSNSHYEVIIYHGGGESLQRSNLKFILNYDDGSRDEVVPWWVYERAPEDCMFVDIGDSSLSTREYWGTSNEWKSGETLRFRNMVTATKMPIGMDILHYPFKSPMVKVNFKDQIKKTDCVIKGNPALCDNPEDELIPVLLSPKKGDHTGCDKCGEGNCEATFTYSYKGDPLPPPPIQSSWNYFTGNTTPVIIMDNFTEDESMKKKITVGFKSAVQWKLGRTMSEWARCE